MKIDQSESKSRNFTTFLRCNFFFKFKVKSHGIRICKKYLTWKNQMFGIPSAYHRCKNARQKFLLVR